MRFGRSDSPGDILPLKAGLYAYERGDEAGGRIRLHLRLDADGRGLLIVNAARVLHLNRTAAEYLYLILEGMPEAEVIRRMCRCYRVSASTARADHCRVREQLEAFLHPEEGRCPVAEMELGRVDPFSVPLSAPYRMDLALTYRCDNVCPHCYVARPSDYPEMDTEAWKAVLERVWQVGIPHVCFTGGEATLRPDLSELVSYAQQRGLVSGLLTHGRRLADRAYVDELVAAGLDHVQITLESHDPAVHDRMVGARGAWQETVQGIRNALASGLYTTTNTTLTRENVPDIVETVAFIASLGVPTFACNSLIYAGRGARVNSGLPEGELSPLLERVREEADRRGLRLIWYTPTRYCALSPLQLELGVKACTAALYNMCVEPDGMVIPCQSYYRPLGHILNDPWEAIWNHDLARFLRERRYVPEACRECPELPLCGGGCPLYLEYLEKSGRITSSRAGSEPAPSDDVF